MAMLTNSGLAARSDGVLADSRDGEKVVEWVVEVAGKMALRMVKLRVKWVDAVRPEKGGTMAVMLVACWGYRLECLKLARWLATLMARWLAGWLLLRLRCCQAQAVWMAGSVAVARGHSRVAEAKKRGEEFLLGCA